MANQLNLFVNADDSSLVAGFTSTARAILPRFVLGDVVPLSVRSLTGNTSDSSLPWSEQDLTGRSIRVAIGNPAGPPTAGTFRLTFDGNTTGNLAYNATADVVQTALNALASITAAGGVTVTKSTGGVYRIIFDDVGEQEPITADTAALYPSTGAQIFMGLEGDVDSRQVVVIRLENFPAAFVDLTDELPPAAAEVTVVRAGGVGISEIQSLFFPVEAYDGSYSLMASGHRTSAIAYNATALAVQGALQAAHASFAGKVTVTGAFPRYTVEFDVSLGAVGAMTPNLAGLVVPTGRTGEISLNTAGIVELLNGQPEVSTRLEIELYETATGKGRTVAQTAVTVVDDVIGNIPASQTPLPIFLTVEALDGYAVRHDVEQDLSESGMARARRNIAVDVITTDETYPMGAYATISGHPDTNGGQLTFDGDPFTPSRLTRTWTGENGRESFEFGDGSYLINTNPGWEYRHGPTGATFVTPDDDAPELCDWADGGQGLAEGTVVIAIGNIEARAVGQQCQVAVNGGAGEVDGRTDIWVCVNIIGGQSIWSPPGNIIMDSDGIYRVLTSTDGNIGTEVAYPFA